MERRTLLKRMTQALGAVFGLVLGLPGMAYLIDPRNRRLPDGKFHRLTRLSELPKPEPGQSPTPQQFIIRETRRDAWTLHPEKVVGRVWLVRYHDDQVVAFTSTCPHLGCSINHDVDNERFLCPCHRGEFQLTGERMDDPASGRTNPAPRGMDQLAMNRPPVEGSEDDFHIEVEYQEFRQGLHDSVPKT